MGEITLTDEQLDAIVTKRLETALANHQRGMDALKANRDEILAEKRELERSQAAARSARLSEAADRAIDQMYGRNQTPAAANTSHVLSREDARDPAKYRAAKAAAQAAGIKTGPTVTDTAASAQYAPGTVPPVVQTERRIYLRRDVGQDPAEYRRFRRLADQGGKSLTLYESRNDLDEANSRDPSALSAFDAATRGDGK